MSLHLHPRPLSLTDEQLRLITQTAGALRLDLRSDFLRGLALRLPSRPTDVDVRAAIAEQLKLIAQRFVAAQQERQPADEPETTT